MKGLLARLTRNDLVILTTALSMYHNDSPEDEEVAKMYKRMGDMLELAPGDDD